MHSTKREEKKQQRIKETIQYIISNVQNASTNFKEKVKYSDDGKNINLLFPKGFVIISVKLNKDERTEFINRIPTVGKHLKKVKTISPVN